MVGSLSNSQLSAYRENGYLCPVRVFAEDEARKQRDALEALEATPADAIPRPCNQYLRVNAHLISDVPLAVAANPMILDCVESILGPDILMWGCEYFIKEPHTHKIVSWHQDLTYWGMDGSDHEVTAWVALSPATEASGCMKFVPGSHKQQIVPHTDTFSEDNLLSRGQEIAVDVDEADAIAAALQPGEMSLHHGRLFHASGPNTTDERRIGLVMRYIRPDTPSVMKNDYAMVMRGSGDTGPRLPLNPLPGTFTKAQLAHYDQVLAAQSATLTAGAESAVSLYD